MSSYIDASHNMLFTMDKDRWLADLTKSDRADITGYQEAEGSAQRATLKEYCVANKRGLFHPSRSGNPISWKKDVFTILKLDGKLVRGITYVHKSAPAMGVPAKFTPARDFTWVGLTHKATGKKVLRINVHPTAGGTKLERDPDNTDSAEMSRYRDWSIGQYWLDVLSFTAAQMSLQDPGDTAMTGLWEIVSLGGDYNGYLDRTDRWYYPGALLPALYVQDKTIKGLDHLQHAHGSDVKVGKRWTVGGNTDHRIHFQERTIITVPDFPRQL